MAAQMQAQTQATSMATAWPGPASMSARGMTRAMEAQSQAEAPSPWGTLQE